MSRRLTIVAVSALVLAPATADAVWTGPGTGNAYARAGALETTAAPVATVANRSVTVGWDAPAGGPPPSGYLVQRYDEGGVEHAVEPGCSGTVAATTCVEDAVPAGIWRYRVTPANADWRGAESADSAPVTVDPPGLELDDSSLPSLPAEVSGELTHFISGQTVTFRLDDPVTGAVISGEIAPTPVPTSGTSSVSVTIPAGTSAGSHPVFAIGDQGDVASAPLTILTPQALTMTAYELRDASAGGAEANSSDPFAFASDSRTVATGTPPPAAFNTGRYVQLDYGGALPTNAIPSAATFDFRFAAASGLTTACFYFDVRRASTDAVLATHGSSGSPVGCSSSTSLQSFSTSLPEVNTVAIANDLRVRVYVRDSLVTPPTLDQATVSVASDQGAFTLYGQSVGDTVNGLTTIDRTWSLVAADSNSYASGSVWSASFAANRYLRLVFPTAVPSGATVTGASVTHGFRRVTLGTACWYLEVLQGSTVIGTHGSATSPISCNSSATFTTDTVSLPELDTPARINGAVLKLYVRHSAGLTTEHDQAVLDVTYSN